jgi:flagellar biosynthesis protein FliP
MVVLLAANGALVAPSQLPDLTSRLHPSDSTPWTIVLVLTLITLLPAILMCMTPLVRFQPHVDGPGADDDVVSDDPGASAS